MTRDIDDRDLRRRIDHNLGDFNRVVVIPAGPPAPGRYGQLFTDGDFVGGGPPTGPREIVPSGTTFPTLPQGRIIGLASSLATGNREVLVTDTLPSPSVIRALTITGNLSIAGAQSFRILLANDADTTAVADPTGQDLIEFAGDVIGAEDVGVHMHLTAGPVTVEPWKRILSGGQRLKLKFHNVSGGTLVMAVYIDLDDLVI